MKTANRKTQTSIRKSRLRKAALTFLVAATAAFFVCAPAGALAPVSSPIRVVSKTNNQVLVDATTTDVFVQTNVIFSKVEWSVNGTALPTDNVPGTRSQITYNFSNARQGSVFRFTATPYERDLNGNHVAGESAAIEITAIKAISSVTMGQLQSNIVVGE